ncbi:MULTISPECIES: aromatic amino acid DMT transporter YddG [Comamonas]|uniref:Aromatic amino acid exporter n=1 Tax=Comamonas testosteroni TaxID=285 RepID=A0A096HAL2_COMTE|nr:MULTISPECIES: aromatic amino acid DMT transporter YddG [Comamonas]KGH25892.1 aromatic amino acid exporter [Comamonas testosteroni]MPT11771.1 drug/metabolite DMT transporter permease [Comamonas sp.]
MNPTEAAARRATLIGLLAVLCWSCTVGLMRAVAEPLGAVGGAACLYTMAAICVAAARGRKGWRELARWRSMHPAYLWGCGLLFVVYEICLSVAVGLAHDRSQAMEIGLINYLWPSLTIVLAVLCGQQAARWWLWPGVLICLWGLARVLGGDSFSLPVMWSHVLGNPLAYGMGFAAALLWPAYSLLARRYGSGFNAVGLFVTWTAIALWLKWLMLGEPQPMLWSWLTTGQLLLVGALTALGYSCWEHGIQHGKLALLAAASYFTPVLSALMASALLQVLPGWSFWQGVALVTLGSLVCWWATRTPAPA